MVKHRALLPTRDQLKGLHRWARVVLLARAVRRIQPLYAFGWPKAPAKALKAIADTIAYGESSAAAGKANASPNAKGMAMMKFYGEVPDEFLYSNTYIYEIPYATSRVAFACGETEPWFASEGLVNALNVASSFERQQKLGDARHFARLIQVEFNALLEKSRQEKWKKDTPVASDLLGPLWPKGTPAGWPEPLQQRPAKVARPKPVDLKPLRLPRELVAFLKAGKKLKYAAARTEVGPIALHSPENLQLGSFEVVSDGTPAHEEDPNRGKRGHYSIPAVDLVAECDAYGAEGILAWLPEAKCFGQWDPDHMRLLLFPGVKWADIEARPAKYLDAQWNDYESFAEHPEPWKLGKFVRQKRR